MLGLGSLESALQKDSQVPQAFWHPLTPQKSVEPDLPLPLWWPSLQDAD